MTIVIVPGNAAYDELNSQPMVAFRNLLTEGTIASGTLPTGGPRANAVTQDTSEFWDQPTVGQLRCTLGAATTASICFIGAHNLGTAGVTLSVERFNGSWNTITSYAPTNNNPFMIVFPDESQTGFGVAVSGACQIGVAWVGPRLIIPGGVTPDYTPIWAASRVDKFPAITRRGHFRGQRIERSGASLSAQFMPMTHTFARDTMATFRQRFNEGDAFIWAAAPRVFSTDVAYCWADEGSTIDYTIRAGGDLVNMAMQMEAYVERPS
jgi:hypothetical protein